MTGTTGEFHDDLPLTPKEVAARERVTVEMVKKALKNRRLIGYQIGERHDWRIRESAYRAWVAAGAPTAKLGEEVEA
ncbi:MAG TPA: hypothetical protein VF808_14390 [Ktedonobacterales bacterium]